MNAGYRRWLAANTLVASVMLGGSAARGAVCEERLADGERPGVGGFAEICRAQGCWVLDEVQQELSLELEGVPEVPLGDLDGSGGLLHRIGIGFDRGINQGRLGIGVFHPAGVGSLTALGEKTVRHGEAILNSIKDLGIFCLDQLTNPQIDVSVLVLENVALEDQWC